MKQELNPKVTGIIIAVVAVVLIAGAVLYFNDSFSPTPTVEAKPWRPPGAWAGAPGGPGPGAPAPPQGSGKTSTGK